MPLYDFKCDGCENTFEKLQKISDPAPLICPCCGQSGKVHQCVSAPHFRLAGSGWYETDFKSNLEKRRNLSNQENKPSPSSKI